MTSKRMTLSLVALIGSVFLFVFASFAWLQVSDIVHILDFQGNVQNVEAEAAIFTSTDGGETFVLTPAIDISSSVPGDTMYYQIFVENTGETDIYSRVLLYGFTDELADELGTQTGYLLGNSLLQVTSITVSNNNNSETIANQTMIDLLPLDFGADYSNDYIILANQLAIPVGGSAVVTISFTISGDAGNDYQNLALLISSVSIQSVSQ